MQNSDAISVARMRCRGRQDAAVGWAKAHLRRAHHRSTHVMVGTLRFAHPHSTDRWRPTMTTDYLLG